MSDVVEMDVLDQSGHFTVKWNPDVSDEVDAARKTFTEWKAKGYTALHTKGPRKGDRMDTFDPQAKGVTMVPQLRGG